MRSLAIALASIALLLVHAPAGAQSSAPYDPKAAFAETDTNKDGLIDQDEMYQRIVDVFYHADTNKDGYLTVEEYQRLPFPGDFKAADKNGDGRISLREYLLVREQAFDAADANHDKELTLEEVITVYEGKTK